MRIALNMCGALSTCDRNGRTNLAAGLRTVRTKVFTSSRGTRDSAEKILIVITTTPSFNETETVDEAMRLRADGVSIIGVGVGRSVSRSELEGVVSYPVNRNAFYVDDYSHLSSYVNNVVNSQCNGRLLSNLGIYQVRQKVIPKIICCFLSKRWEFRCKIWHIHVSILSTLNCQAQFNNL